MPNEAHFVWFPCRIFPAVFPHILPESSPEKTSFFSSEMPRAMAVRIQGRFILSITLDGGSPSGYLSEDRQIRLFAKQVQDSSLIRYETQADAYSSASIACESRSAPTKQRGIRQKRSFRSGSVIGAAFWVSNIDARHVRFRTEYIATRHPDASGRHRYKERIRICAADRKRRSASPASEKENTL